MRTVVFLGPTLDAGEARSLIDAEIKGPARQGDVFRAVRDGAEVIGLVDGLFETVPAVLHKEILWALDRGVRVVGAASMGALRAAELHPFGMEGIGAVFAAYRDGHLIDDDEVAVVHGPAELGYLPLSVAMVDLRASFAEAARSGVVSGAEADHCIACAKRLHYKDRSYEGAIEAAGLDAGPAGRALRDWLKDHRVERKKMDARELLFHLAAISERGRAPVPRFSFQESHWWSHHLGHQGALK